MIKWLPIVRVSAELRKFLKIMKNKTYKIYIIGISKFHVEHYHAGDFGTIKSGENLYLHNLNKRLNNYSCYK